METFDMVQEVHDTKNFDIKRVFDSEEAIRQDLVGVEQNMQVQRYTSDVRVDRGNLKVGYSVEAYAWSFIDSEDEMQDMLIEEDLRG